MKKIHKSYNSIITSGASPFPHAIYPGQRISINAEDLVMNKAGCPKCGGKMVKGTCAECGYKKAIRKSMDDEMMEKGIMDRAREIGSGLMTKLRGPAKASASDPFHTFDDNTLARLHGHLTLGGPRVARDTVGQMRKLFGGSRSGITNAVDMRQRIQSVLAQRRGAGISVHAKNPTGILNHEMDNGGRPIWSGPSQDGMPGVPDPSTLSSRGSSHDPARTRGVEKTDTLNPYAHTLASSTYDLLGKTREAIGHHIGQLGDGDKQAELHGRAIEAILRTHIPTQLADGETYHYANHDVIPAQGSYVDSYDPKQHTRDIEAAGMYKNAFFSNNHSKTSQFYHHPNHTAYTASMTTGYTPLTNRVDEYSDHSRTFHPRAEQNVDKTTGQLFAVGDDGNREGVHHIDRASYGRDAHIAYRRQVEPRKGAVSNVSTYSVRSPKRGVYDTTPEVKPVTEEERRKWQEDQTPWNRRPIRY